MRTRGESFRLIRTSIVPVVIVGILVMPSPVRGQDEGAQQLPSNPLAPFERLIGGQWHLQGSYQEFEWGVGRESVKARSYFLVDGEPKLVSEGIWFWHPGEQQIRGFFTAIDMPVVFLDYTTRFEGNQMMSDVRTYGSEGNENTYVEIWDFASDTSFVWSLLRRTPDGLKEEMGGTYTRK